MKQRTKRFALDIIRLAPQLPKTAEGRIVGNQLLRCSTSVGANYRAVCRAKSKADFISKRGIVEEEADESCYWLELIIEGEILPEAQNEAVADPQIKNQKSKFGNALRWPEEPA